MSAQERKGTQNRWIGFSEDDVDRRRPKILSEALLRKSGDKSALTNALRTTRSTLDMTRAQHDHFPQHAQAVAEKTTLLPLAWFHRTGTADPETGPMREIKQLHVECETFDPRRFKDRSTRLEAKRFKSTLGVPNGNPWRAAPAD